MKDWSSLWREYWDKQPLHDPLLSKSREPAWSKSGAEELLDEEPIGSRADHMEFADGLAGFEPSPSEGAIQPLLGLASYHENDDVLDIL